MQLNKRMEYIKERKNPNRLYCMPYALISCMPYALISTSTPLASSSFISASMVLGLAL